MSNHTFSDVLNQLGEGLDFTRKEAAQALDFIISGEVNEAQTAAFLFGMRQKGETIEELTGFVEAMRAVVLPLDVDTTGAVDVCGTGGDHSGSFNISTGAMFVVAGAGVPVLKHGNRSISSKSGSYDVLESLGIVPGLKPEHAKSCFEQTGLTFMFAPLYPPAMKFVMPARRSLAMRSFFNIMGPLLNPAGVKRQVIGTYDIHTAQRSAEILGNLGAESAVTVHSDDGMDEFSTAASSGMFVLNGSMLSVRQEFKPEDLGFLRSTHAQLKGGDKEENAGIISNILSGKATQPQTDIVLLNSAFAIKVSGKTDDLSEALLMARESIRSGAAAQKLELLKQTSQDLHHA